MHGKRLSKYVFKLVAIVVCLTRAPPSLNHVCKMEMSHKLTHRMAKQKSDDLGQSVSVNMVKAKLSKLHSHVHIDSYTLTLTGVSEGKSKEKDGVC